MRTPPVYILLVLVCIGAASCGLIEEEPAGPMTPEDMMEASSVDWATDTALACNEYWSGNSAIYRWERPSSPLMLETFLLAAWAACEEHPEYAIYQINSGRLGGTSLRIDIAADGWIFLRNLLGDG